MYIVQILIPNFDFKKVLLNRVSIYTTIFTVGRKILYSVWMSCVLLYRREIFAIYAISHTLGSSVAFRMPILDPGVTY